MTPRDFEDLAPGPWTLDPTTGDVRDAEGTRLARIDLAASGSHALARLLLAAPELLAYSQELYDQARWNDLGANAAWRLHLDRLHEALEATRPHRPLTAPPSTQTPLLSPPLFPLAEPAHDTDSESLHANDPGVTP